MKSLFAFGLQPMRGVPALLCATLLVLVGCGAPRPEQQATLRVITVPESASVTLDESYLGNSRVLARQPAPTSVGAHRLSIEADGYFPHDLDVELVPGETRIEVRLREVPQ